MPKPNGSVERHLWREHLDLDGASFVYLRRFAKTSGFDGALC